jgi:hypothetical protein
MTQPISDTDLARLKELEAQTTPGPWAGNVYPKSSVEEHADMYREQLKLGVMTDDGNPVVYHIGVGEYGTDSARTICMLGNGPTSESNGAFILAARNHLPALIARLEKAEERVKELESEIVDTLYEATSQAAGRDTNGDWNSFGIGSVASDMRRLAKIGRLTIVREYGRVVTARPVEATK